ncbi:hypothetical protein [Paenibacillus sp. sgz500992]|uniref:hypothetical protein n=1 Tax=Paenibacillus sp. sgz500992 TaxID=3242476 RepID=UPI0036D34E4B
MTNKHGIITLMLLVILSTFTACDSKQGSGEDTVLSMDKVRSLAQQGEDLAWTDFEGYPFEDVGSGLYIRKYAVEEDYHVLVSGRSLDKAPDTVYLVNPTGEQIDLRHDDDEDWKL